MFAIAAVLTLLAGGFAVYRWRHREPPTVHETLPDLPEAPDCVVLAVASEIVEEAMADWLSDRGLDITIAEPLADTAVTFEALDSLARAISGPALNTVLQIGRASCRERV